jgi:IS605 OrfB family transposase
MLLTLKLPLNPMPDQQMPLLATMHRFNAACTWIATQAHHTHTTNKIALQKLVYYAVRDQFGLSAQLTIRAIAKVAETYKRDPTKLPYFRPQGAVVYDERVLSIAATHDSISILTLAGRLRVPLHVCAYHAAILAQTTVRGQADLVYQQGRWYLLLVIALPEPICASGDDFLGIDLGIVNLATDSDGAVYSGAGVERTRRILAHRRRNLQRKGTKAAKRKLRQLSGKQARFQRNTNHGISKRIVQTAKDTGRGLALEQLTGIRSRVTVKRPQRARHANWAFFQLKSFLVYKAIQAGIRVQTGDPRNTSRTCQICGYCAKANRKSQSQFVCGQCGFAALADANAAVNIRQRVLVARAAVMRPLVSIPADTVSVGDQGQAAGL